jgi:hypothetical protein
LIINLACPYLNRKIELSPKEQFNLLSAAEKQTQAKREYPLLLLTSLAVT